MKLPAFKRLYYTDFQSQFQQLVEQLSYTINNGFEGLYSALDNNISLRDNLYASVNDVTITVDATGKPIAGGTFGISNSNPIDGTMVIRAINGTSNIVFPTGGIFLTYTQNGNKITITNVTGLPANNQYTLRVVAFLT